MRDLFDDFLDELRRREAVARGEDPDAGAPPRARRVGPDADADADEALSDEPGSPAAGSADDDDEAAGARDARTRGADRSDPHRAGRPTPPRGSAARDIRTARAGRPGGRRFGLWVGAAIALLLFIVLTSGLDLWTDALWYRSVGFDGVFWTRLAAQGALFAGAGAVALIALLGNLAIARRLSPTPDDGSSGGTFRGLFDRLTEATQAAEAGRGRPGGPWNQAPARPVSFGADDIPDLTPLAGIALVVVSVLLALAVAGSVSSAWETVLVWQNRVPFSPGGAAAVVDPVFHRDIGFFLFELPFLRFIQALVNGLVLASIVLVLARYLVAASGGGRAFPRSVRIHLAILGALFMVSVAAGYQLDKYELVYSTRGVATGVSFTDQNAQFFAFDLLSVVSALAAIALIAGAFARRLWPLGLTIAVWLVASVVVGRLYPEAIQRFTVAPNQYAQEEPFIANNIAMTRLAYGLSTWEDRSFRGEAVLTQSMINADADTFQNARLWDYRPLATTLDQLQTVRRYYTFHDVDTDRYEINGVQRQVMLAGRELALDQNPSAVGFVNQRIIYTHGIGLAMVPVNEVANGGQPRLFIGNLPPVSTAGAPPVTQPRIYFGERDSSYVVVGARLQEFDYPTGDSAKTSGAGTNTTWTGTTGLKLDNTLMRLLFALRFRDLDLLISDQVTRDSQLLFHRALGDRLQRIAPFLRYDRDPYLVVDGAGHLQYIQDAYTVSDRFPDAQAFDPSGLERTNLGSDPINYIRNSVKVTMDAYDGTMHFYVADPSDPIIRAYQGVFPTLLEPLSAMPASLRDHLRVPEELFNVQTRVFGRYHVKNTQQFFSSDDVWTVPQGQTSEQTLPSEAYYVVMRMPGETKSEFLLLQPMVPINRPNMIAWIAARNDQPNYGTTRVYRFPSSTSVFGPAQIEARIDQDPKISEQFTLWNQSGSKVIRGNLIVLPIGDSLLYLQPVYLQSTGSAFPEFRRIVVASPREVVWAETLGDALKLLLAAEAGQGPTPSPTPGSSPAPGSSPTPAPTPGPTASSGPVEPLPTDVAGLISYANAHFELAQAALKAGDFASYGQEIGRVQAALRQLDVLAPGLAGPSPVPSASPAP